MEWALLMGVYDCFSTNSKFDCIIFLSFLYFLLNSYLRVLLKVSNVAYTPKYMEAATFSK